MLTFGQIALLQPWVLSALISLPVIWWLLRFIPPRPRRQPFPPLRLLLELKRTEETPDRSPWWLTALRILAAALVICAFARPILNPRAETADTAGPLVLVVDNGWASGEGWDDRHALLQDLLRSALRNRRDVALVATADPGALALEPASEAMRRAETLAPQPWAPRRADALDRLAAAMAGTRPSEIVWLADGLDYGDGAAFADGLDELAGGEPVSVYMDAGKVVWLPPAQLEAGSLVAEVTRLAGGPAARGEVTAYALNGRVVEQQPFAIEAGAASGRAVFALPTDLRNQIARLEIATTGSAGGVTLLDERWQRRTVAMVAGGSVELAQPLLAPLYYVERALGPTAQLRRPTFGETIPAMRDMLEGGVAMLVLADVGRLIESDHAAVAEWVENGGTLVRFAGPRLAASADDLLPVRLRQGGRSLGGALSWEEPQRLSPLEDGPFAGLNVPVEVTVNQQVLAEPDITLGEKTWARLQDGTPLVTAERRGKGRIVLFHVTANADWSSLPLSGLFVEMLQRLLRLTQSVSAGDGEGQVGADVLAPNLTLNGRGRLGAPPPTATPILAAEAAETRAGPQTPPGFYGPTAAGFALNTVRQDDSFAPLAAPAGATRLTYSGASEIQLLPWLILAAVGLLLIDVIAVLALSGGLFARRAAPVAGALVVFLLGPMLLGFGAADAQDAGERLREEFALKAALETRLAYVMTGDAEVDAVSEAGMRGLSRQLADRTALEPASPMGVDIERDEIVFFPLLYWAVSPDAETPSEAALLRLDAYMKNGGTILFDTRDEAGRIANDPAGAPTGARALQRILGELDIPTLEPVPASHVLTKAFYLLQAFPGRFEGGRLWVEAGGESDPTRGQNADGVSSIIIGSNDFAGAWARDEDGRPMLPLSSGDERQRELAYRVGINIVMYALTGNYKADQVHVPALLERLGQ